MLKKGDKVKVRPLDGCSEECVSITEDMKQYFDNGETYTIESRHNLVLKEIPEWIFHPDWLIPVVDDIPEENKPEENKPEVSTMTKRAFLIAYVLNRSLTVISGFDGVGAVRVASEAWEEINKLAK